MIVPERAEQSKKKREKAIRRCLQFKHIDGELNWLRALFSPLIENQSYLLPFIYTYIWKRSSSHNCSSSTDALKSIANFIVVEIVRFVCHTRMRLRANAFDWYICSKHLKGNENGVFGFFSEIFPSAHFCTLYAAYMYYMCFKWR